MFTQSLLPEEGILIISFEGNIDTDEVEYVAKVVFPKAIDSGLRLIFDLSKVIVTISISQACNLIESSWNLMNENERKVDFVFIVDNSDYVFYRTLQNIWINRGVYFVLFTDLEVGKRWFIKEVESTKVTDQQKPYRMRVI
ncbi:MAG: hypothetical protein ACFHWX_07705 [Bacteroidota bacterium]